MKGIVITFDNRISVQEFGAPLYKTVGAVVGGGIEHVLPKRLPQPLCMIVNEDGHRLGLPINLVGSYLYQTDKHGYPILGTIVIMQDGWSNGGPDIVGIHNEDVLRIADSFTKKFNLTMKEETHHDQTAQ